jgi:hypothetical protein
MAHDSGQDMAEVMHQVRRLDEALNADQGGDEAALDEAIEACSQAMVALMRLHSRLLVRVGHRPWIDGGSGPGWSPDRPPIT